MLPNIGVSNIAYLECSDNNANNDISVRNRFLHNVLATKREIVLYDHSRITFNVNDSHQSP